MASRKPLTQSTGLLEQLQAVDTLTVGDYDLPNTISDDGKVLVTVNSAAVWEFYSHADLTNITVDDHHDKLHTHNGADGSGVVEHSDTANIAVDDHHDKLHTHNGADGSGVVEHDDTANGTIVNHDTDATGTELDTLTDGSNADSLHTHSGSSLITTAQSYYVSLTGSDSTGDGSTGSRWATIQHALDYVYDQLWGAGSSATIYIEEGEYRAAEITVQNKHCPLITIRGEDAAQDVTSVSIDSVTASGGGVYAVTLTVDSTVGLSTGQYLIFRGGFGSRDPLNGAWEITNIADSTTLTIEILTRTLVPGTGAFAVPCRVVKVILTSTDTTVFSVVGSYITFSELSIASTDNVTGIAFYGVNNIEVGPNVTATGLASYGLYVTAGSTVVLTRFSASRCGYGAWIEFGSQVEGDYCNFTACDTDVLFLQSIFNVTNSYVGAGLSFGLRGEQGSSGVLSSALLKDCAIGARAFVGTEIEMLSSTVANNGTDFTPASGSPGGNILSWIRVA